MSSHYQNWLRCWNALENIRSNTIQMDSSLFSREEVERIKLMYCRVISELASQSNLRQRVAATAVVYFKRFFLKRCIKDHDPRLIAPVALYLAAKVEEHTLLAKVIIANMSNLYPGEHAYPYAVSHVYDYEFKLIDALDFDLIIYHPYRPMMQLCASAKLTDLLATAWPILNDSYLTDVCLQFPPYLIAVACVYLAGTLADRDLKAWISSLSISTQDLAEVAQRVTAMYTSPPQSLPTAGSPVEQVLMNKLHAHFGPKILNANSPTLSSAVAPPSSSVLTPSSCAAAANGAPTALGASSSSMISKRPPPGTKRV